MPDPLTILGQSWQSIAIGSLALWAVVHLLRYQADRVAATGEASASDPGLRAQIPGGWLGSLLSLLACIIVGVILVALQKGRNVASISQAVWLGLLTGIIPVVGSLLLAWRSGRVKRAFPKHVVLLVAVVATSVLLYSLER